MFKAFKRVFSKKVKAKKINNYLKQIEWIQSMSCTYTLRQLELIKELHACGCLVELIYDELSIHGVSDININQVNKAIAKFTKETGIC